jgi:cytochrome c551/c552
MIGKAVPASLFIIAGMAMGQTQTRTPAFSLDSQQALVGKYCSGCHNDKLKSGGFSWTKIDLAHPDANAVQAEKVIRKVRAGMMPPSGMPRPSIAEMNGFASAIEAGIDKAATLNPVAGTPDLHRLNRTEYHNSIQDLLGVDVDVSTMLPPDDLSHGFDNIADALTTTPALMTGYLRAAGKISRLAVGDTDVAPTMAKYDVPKVANQMRHVDGAPSGTRGGISVEHNFPADGDYTFKLALYYYYTEELYGRALPPPLQGQEIEISVDGERVALFTINPATPERNANFLTPAIHVKAGAHRVSAAFLSKTDGPLLDEDRLVEQALVDTSIGLDPGRSTLPHLHSLIITGPLNVTGISETASRRKILTCHPETEALELPCAKKVIGTLARKAYRQPVSDSDMEELLTAYQQGKNENNFETGIRMAIQAMIANPEFVFRIETAAPANLAPGKSYRISDLELASRLSFFLWSRGPDDELIALASANKLHQPAVLEQQVHRMLADSRSEALAVNFASEWLRLPGLKEVDPDGELFGDFTRNLALSMVRETQLLFESIMHEDRPITELLTANYTFVDEVLAKHYGIPEVLGTQFQRVPITDPNRYGLLGEGSVLTLTSVANRTSPVARGKYVMEVILGTPPPAPPPNVPPLKEATDHNAKNPTVRERMEQHRANEPCHSCHQMMDPIGLSLENFDAVGVWRIRDMGMPIDSSGQMFDGTKLDGPISLRNAILAHRQSFVGAFTENLLSYGLGRVIDYQDMPVVRSIEHAADKDNDRFSDLVLGVIRSASFQRRTVRPTRAKQAEEVAAR